ncbi:plasmid stabilization protein [Burkholderia singularis]|uniref:Plasmid stabilization protein n=1 Tax=Burkholderia singularis TaxID=1503053 RepID=A0A103E8R3_9BURK|nr:type II toxin-antitoxin system RelE/ParE family toxin [Burkholderia singularis]KVE30151.1 plasmid stabilization protein [Burkholderia singularis]
MSASGSTYRVILSPEVRDKLDEIEARIVAAGAPQTAARYVDAIVEYCASLATFPERGVPRDDLLAGLRLTHYRKRAVIAYRVSEKTVSILGVYYGGQDYEAQFSDEPDDAH